MFGRSQWKSRRVFTGRSPDAAAGLFVTPASAQIDQPLVWAGPVQSGLEAIRDLLAENHPGSVDPENRRYREWLHDGFSQASHRAEMADSLAGYECALRYFVNGFHDGKFDIYPSNQENR